MRRTNLLALMALGTMAALAVYSQADALQTTKAFKLEFMTFNVTPSPTPFAMHWPMHRRDTESARAVAVSASIAKTVADPYAGPAMIASSGTLWDVAPQSSIMIAQSVSQPTPVPVRFVAKPDPNSLYLRLTPNNVSFNVPYGTTKIACAFTVFTYYTTVYSLSDWAYGTASSGTGSFPMMNYPTTSYLSWAVPDFSATFHPYKNAGQPGEAVWNGTAGQSQTHCVDLTIVVPNSQPSGSFPAIAQYTLIVN